MNKILSLSDILNLKRWNTPSVYNGWEQITKGDRNEGRFNRFPCHDYMEHMGVMVGYAATLIIEPSNPEHQRNNPNAQQEYMEYLESLRRPIIVVVQDLDSPHIGSFWGEVNANMHKAMGCVGTITDGAIRDLDEMTNSGFKAIAKQLCVGHAYSTPVKWGIEIDVFGTRVKPGDLLHADKHGFMAFDADETKDLLEAIRFMDANECDQLLSLSRTAAGIPTKDFISEYAKRVKGFQRNTRQFLDNLKNRG